MANRMTVKNNPDKQRYELEMDGQLAVADYRLAAGRMIITHVGVPKELENRGIGGQLVKAALDDARAKGLKVTPSCPFAAAYIKKHPEYQDLV